MNAKEVAKLRVLLAEATPAKFSSETRVWVFADKRTASSMKGVLDETDRALFVSARNVLPALLDELDALSASGRKLAQTASDAAVEIERRDELLEAAQQEIVALKEALARDAAAMVEMRAKLAVAVEALGLVDSVDLLDDKKPWEIARDALAKIRGGA